jgi:lipoprotein-releasing system permease protein
MIRGITDRYLELGTGHLQVYDFYDDEGVEDAVKKTEALDGVRGAWCERQGLGIILGKHGRIGATIRAVENGFWKDAGSEKFLAVSEGSADLENDREVLLGAGLAESVGAVPGSTVRIMTVRSGEDGSSVPRVTLFTVKGIISSGYRELDSLWCIMNYSAGKELLNSEIYSSFLLVKIDDHYKKADDTAAALERSLGPDYNVYTWKRLQHSLYSSFESTRQILLFIMAILVIVAAVNVSSATSMLVVERQRDIAVLKTSGASPGKIGRVFLWGSFFTGLCGAVIGISLGLLIGRFINEIIRGLERALSFIVSPFGKGEVKFLDPGFYLQEIPIIIDWTSVFMIGLFTIFCSIAASWLPSRRAGKLKPLEILRKI